MTVVERMERPRENEPARHGHRDVTSGDSDRTCPGQQVPPGRRGLAAFVAKPLPIT
jgi:hypothetical protein